MGAGGGVILTKLNVNNKNESKMRMKILITTFLIIVFNLINAQAVITANAGVDRTICLGQTISLGDAKVYTIKKGTCNKITTQWSGPDLSASENAKEHPSIKPISAGTKTYTINVNGSTDDVVINVVDVKFTITVPSSNADRVVFNVASPGVLSFEIQAQPIPNTPEVRALLGNVTFSIDAIGASVLTWSNAGGVGIYDATSSSYKITATFTGLPSKNSDFGKKNIKVTSAVCGNTDPPKEIKVFYDATATNHPAGVIGDPNWFYYYKDALGGGAYTYKNMPGTRSASNSAGGDVSVKISDEAYDGDSYILTSVVPLTGGGMGRKASGVSGITRYFANFVGVLRHEQHHANNEVSPPGPAKGDTDSDWLTDIYENTPAINSDPMDKYSIRNGFNPSNAFSDDECVAGGQIEQAGIAGADITLDWAKPGSQWP